MWLEKARFADGSEALAAEGAAVPDHVGCGQFGMRSIARSVSVQAVTEEMQKGEKMGNRVELDAMGKRILNASRTELYLSMRFLGPALHSLGFIMDLSTGSVGTDAACIRFNPNYLFSLYLDRPRRLNRTYLHMILHCIFRHMFTAREKEDRELWDLASDIAVESIVDSMEYGAVAELTPEHRRRVYEQLEEEIGVLTAERIYQHMIERKRNYLEELQLRAMFAMCDHSFWERLEEDGDEGKEESGEEEERKVPQRTDEGEEENRPDGREQNEEENRGDSREQKKKENRRDGGERKEKENRGDSREQKKKENRRDGGEQKEGENRGDGRERKGDENRRDGGEHKGGENRGDGREQKEDGEKEKNGSRPGGDEKEKEPHYKKERTRTLRSLRKLKDIDALRDSWKETSKRLEAELLTSGKEASDERGSLDRVLAITNRRRTDYREFLRRFAVLREVASVDPDSFDYGFYNYGLEVYGNMPLIEENEFCEANKIRTLVIAIDTSASCQDVLVQRFLNETADVLEGIGRFFHSCEVRIIQCDEHVQDEAVLHDSGEIMKYADRFHVKGGFGTDFRPVFAFVEEKRKTGEIKDLGGLMYFTDGMGIYPEKPVDYDAAFVFTDDGDFDDSKVPDWAIRLYLGPGGKSRLTQVRKTASPTGKDPFPFPRET